MTVTSASSRATCNTVGSLGLLMFLAHLAGRRSTTGNMVSDVSVCDDDDMLAYLSRSSRQVEVGMWR